MLIVWLLSHTNTLNLINIHLNIFSLLAYKYFNINSAADQCKWKFAQDVCLSSTRVAFEFYHTARDAVLLYEVVVPVKVSPCKPVALLSISFIMDWFYGVNSRVMQVYGQYNYEF